MNKKRHLLIGGVALVKTRLKNTGLIMVEVCDDLDGLVESMVMLGNAPFETVSLIIRYGLQNRIKPEFERINKRYSELPVAIELKAEMLSDLDRKNPRLLKEVFSLATLNVLVDVAVKFSLDACLVEKKKRELFHVEKYLG